MSVPEVDPQAADKGAFTKYDGNSDGKLSKEELESAPAIKNGLNRIDTNKDKSIDRQELRDRFSMCAHSGLGASSFAAKVTHNGRPLA